jgi:hypothetical protein
MSRKSPSITIIVFAKVIQAPQVHGDIGNTTTLHHIPHSYDILPDATVLDVMVTRGHYLCYEYGT